MERFSRGRARSIPVMAADHQNREISIRHSNRPCMNTAVLLYMVGAFDFKPPLVLQGTKSKTHRCVSTCFILSFSCGYVLGAVSAVSLATRIAYHITYASRSRHPALREMGFGIWNMTYNRTASQSIVKYVRGTPVTQEMGFAPDRAPA